MTWRGLHTLLTSHPELFLALNISADHRYVRVSVRRHFNTCVWHHWIRRSRGIPVAFVATKLDVFSETTGHFQGSVFSREVRITASVFMATKPGVLKKALRHLRLGFWRPEPDIFLIFEAVPCPEVVVAAKRRSLDVSSCVYCHQNQMFFPVKWPCPAVFVENNTGYFFCGFFGVFWGDRKTFPSLLWWPKQIF